MSRLALKLTESQAMLVVGGIVAAAIGTMALGGYFIYRARVIESYPTASGVVTSQKIESVLGHHSLSLHYRFEVAGKAHQGFYHVSSDQQDEIEDKAATFAQGSNVTVYYNPNNANESHLETKRGKGVLMIVLPPLVVGGAIAAALVWHKISGHAGSIEINSNKEDSRSPL